VIPAAPLNSRPLFDLGRRLFRSSVSMHRKLPWRASFFRIISSWIDYTVLTLILDSDLPPRTLRRAQVIVTATKFSPTIPLLSRPQICRRKRLATPRPRPISQSRHLLRRRR
jgi:hypothetical protein